jgi:hypothetical protein
LRNREFRAIHAPREFVHRRVRGNWLPVAVAGACLLALGTAFWLKGQLVRNSGTESAHSGAEVVADHQDQWTSDWLRPDARFSSVTALAKRMPGEFDYWLDSSATAYQWAGLDHDARLTIRMLASRLPFDVGASLAATGDSL